MITIIIEGPENSGKSHVIALLGKYMKSLGCHVTIQSEETHNAATLAMTEEQLLARLCESPITITEMRTTS
jgi:thymidylate kinase